MTLQELFQGLDRNQNYILLTLEQNYILLTKLWILMWTLSQCQSFWPRAKSLDEVLSTQGQDQDHNHTY